MLFENIRFLILPNLNASSTQFRCNLLRQNGGIIIDSVNDIDDKTVILIVDSFVNTNEDGIEEFALFKKESVYDLDQIYDDVVKFQLHCFKVSRVGLWLSEVKSPQDDLDKSIHFKQDIEDDQKELESNESSQDENDLMTINEVEKVVSSESEDSNHDSEYDVWGAQGSFEAKEPTATTPSSPSEINQKYINLNSSAQDNKLLIDTLKNLSKKYKVKGDTFRARGYDLAKSSIEKCTFKITSGQQAQRELANIGPSIGKKIQTILDTGTLPGVEVVTNMEQTLSYFQNCHGVGPHRAKRWTTLKMNNFNDILTKIPEEFITEWPSLYGWMYYEDWSKRIPRRESEYHLKKVKEYLQKVDPICDVELHGSYNRGKENSGDIDLLFFKDGCDDMDEIANILQELAIKLYEEGYIKCILQLNPTLYDMFANVMRDTFKKCGLKYPGKKSIVTSKSIRTYYLGVKLNRSEFKFTPQELEMISKTGVPNQLRPEDGFFSMSVKREKDNPCRRLDFFSCKWSQLGAARMQWTGSAEFNRWIRLRATGMGYKLTQHGLFKGEDLIESFDERRIFKILDVPYIGYEEREQGLWQKRVKDLDE